MEASMIFNCSRTTAATLPNTFAFWQMLDIRVWQNFMKTARHLLRNPNTMLWRKERNREIVSWLGNELWLSIFFVNWKSFASCARGIAIAERDLLCVSTWSLQSTTLNSTQTDFCKRSNQESVSLRLVYKDGVLTFLSSPNGLAWYRISESNVKFNILHVGLIAGQNSKDPSPVLFDYFKVKALK